jgi:F420-0:gamma-glutamyl ligase
MSTLRWSDLRAEHDVRYTGVEIFLVITMSKTSEMAEGLYGLVVGVSGQKIRQEFSSV